MAESSRRRDDEADESVGIVSAAMDEGVSNLNDDGFANNSDSNGNNGSNGQRGAYNDNSNHRNNDNNYGLHGPSVMIVNTNILPFIQKLREPLSKD